MTTSLIERLLFWRDTANLRSREIIRLNAEVEGLRGELTELRIRLDAATTTSSYEERTGRKYHEHRRT